MQPRLVIRRYRPGDEAKAYEVCLRTGDAGGDATGCYDDPELLGHIYVGPYLALAPDFSFMLVDESETVVGYAVGAPDTVAFERACERSWWPPLRQRYPEAPRRESDARLVRQLHRPVGAAEDVVARYPAHLHIDLLPLAQGQGHGRSLMQALMAALAGAGASGVHLGVAAVNLRAIAFYERLGFTTIRADAGGRTMARSL